MDWWRYNVHAEKDADFFRAHAHCGITDTERVVGLFISEYGGDDFFTVVHQSFSTLIPEVLNRGLGIWGKKRPRSAHPFSPTIGRRSSS